MLLFLLFFCSLHAAENARMTYIGSNSLFRHGIPHLINRANIYCDVINLYSTSKDVVNEYPFRVRFSGEKAFDIGGVARDMFSAFFEVAYTKLFDGLSLLIPNDFPICTISPLPTFGAILSHAYIVTGILPIKISFPSLCGMLLNSKSIPDEVFVKSFLNSLNWYEADIVNKAASVVRGGTTDLFPDDIRCGLLDIYSRFGVREIPKPANFLVLITNMAKFHFLRKPAAAISEIKSGIPEVHLGFWNKLSIADLYALYRALQVAPAKVLSLLDDSRVTNQAEERVFEYLKQYIGNMKDDELQNFLRYVTGFSVVSTKAITVSFNALDGLARRPIGHTCTHTIELSTAYVSYMDFSTEFQSILCSNDEFVWMMDAI